MSPARKSTLGAVAVLVGVAAVAGGWHWYWKRHAQPIDGHMTNPGLPQMSFEQFQKAMQDAVYTTYGGSAAGNDFTVMVATPDAGVGELIRSAGSLPVDQADCAPTPAPTAIPFQGVFTSYTLSSDAALTSTLGGQASDALAHLSTSLKSSSAVQFRIDNPKVQLLDDSRIDKITASGACHDYISKHSGVRFVRGIVTGKITYSVSLDHPSDVKADLTRTFGSIDVQQDPGKTTVDISTEAEVPLVSMLSVFEATQVAEAPTPPAPVPVRLPALHHSHAPYDSVQSSGPSRNPASVPSSAQTQLTIHPATATASASNGPVIYVQADTSSPHADATAFAAALQQAWQGAKVVQKVEFVPTAKMPGTAQVRFFNAGDEALANQGLAILKQKYPNARVVRIGLSSPAGQLEVWLPRAQYAKGVRLAAAPRRLADALEVGKSHRDGNNRVSSVTR